MKNLSVEMLILDLRLFLSEQCHSIETQGIASLHHDLYK
jgi:hypothetical protein